jgi:hypothetical protein
VPAFAVGGAGNPGLKPERTTEAEGGFDLAMFNNRATFEVTYYAKRSRDALISRTLAPSLGGPSSRFENIGTVANKGLEVSTNLNLVDTRNFGLSAAINYSTLANKLVSLAPGITPIIYGLGGATERHTPGYPLGSFFQPTFTYADANGNGIIETSEVKVDTAFSYLGNPLPKQSLTIQPQVTLFRNLKLQATIDGRYGFYLFNDTHQFECVTVVNCPEIYVKGSPLYAQAAAIAGTATSAGYIEDASFTKLREIALSYGLPNAWAARLGAKGLNLSLAARNLKTWTKYSGPDPEVSEAGQSNWTFADFLTQPPVRYVVARVNVQF